MLESQLQNAKEHLVSHIQTPSVLTQKTTQTVRLEMNHELSFVVGTGYHTKSQKKSLMYKHSMRLLNALRKITNGDALKAKALSELLAMRTHAGEYTQRHRVVLLC